MITKNFFKATVLSALLLSAAGCKDDDEKENVQNNTHETNTQALTQSASAQEQSNASTTKIKQGFLQQDVIASEPTVDAKPQEPAQTAPASTNVQNGSSHYTENPYATVTQDDMLYKDIPGNEFTMTFTSASFPQGRQVTIDPDDMMPVNDPRRDGRVVLAPRQRFFYEINNQLPTIPGREMASLGPNEGLSPKGSITMYKHLTDEPMMGRNGDVIGGGHGISQEQIMDAMRLCHEPRGVPYPTAE
tara:strand:+ start:4718 stop:5455 length:738 start_codon:yes stop_codon:yes gene_type:complete